MRGEEKCCRIPDLRDQYSVSRYLATTVFHTSAHFYLLSFSEDMPIVAPADGGSRISWSLASQSYLLLHLWSALVYNVCDLRLDCKTQTESHHNRTRITRQPGGLAEQVQWVKQQRIWDEFKGRMKICSLTGEGDFYSSKTVFKLSYSQQWQTCVYLNLIHIIIYLAHLKRPNLYFCLHLNDLSSYSKPELPWKHSRVPQVWHEQSYFWSVQLCVHSHLFISPYERWSPGLSKTYKWLRSIQYDEYFTFNIQHTKAISNAY